MKKFSSLFNEETVDLNLDKEQVVPSAGGQKFMKIHPVKKAGQANDDAEKTTKVFDRKTNHMGNNPGADIDTYKNDNIASQAGPGKVATRVKAVSESDDDKPDVSKRRRSYVEKLPNGKYQLFVLDMNSGKYKAKGDPKSTKENAKQYASVVSEELISEDFRTEHSETKYMDHYKDCLNHLENMKGSLAKHLKANKEMSADLKKEKMEHFWPHHDLKSFSRQLEDLHDRLHEYSSPYTDHNY